MPDSLLQEINQQLAEGAECKELMVEKKKQLKAANAIIDNLHLQITNNTEQISTLEGKVTVVESQRDAAVTESAISKVDKEDAEHKLEAEKHKKKGWRVATLVTGGLVIVEGFLIYFIAQ